MGKAFKWIGIFVVLFIAANVIRIIVTKAKDGMVSSDGKHDVLDGLTGKMAVDRFLEIKEKRDTFNLPAFRTGLMMFQTQHGRFPNDIAELEHSGDLGPEITRDQHGNPYEMKVLNNKTVILYSAGKDRIKGTTDDVQYKIPM